MPCPCASVLSYGSPSVMQRSSGMPRYYIDLQVDDRLEQDPEGDELPDLQVAKRLAIRELAEEAKALSLRPDVKQLCVLVRDEFGRVPIKARMMVEAER